MADAACRTSSQQIAQHCRIPERQTAALDLGAHSLALDASIKAASRVLVLYCPGHLPAISRTHGAAAGRWRYRDDRRTPGDLLRSAGDGTDRRCRGPVPTG